MERVRERRSDGVRGGGGAMTQAARRERPRRREHPVLTLQRRHGNRAVAGMIQRSVGSPAGGCGVCYGTPRDAGIAAHQLVQEQVEIEYPLLIGEFPFFNPLDEENGRLDLALPQPNGLAIGEIKPANPEGYARGEKDLLFYEAQIRTIFAPRNRPGYQVTRLNVPLAVETVFPNGLPGCPVQTIALLPPVDGVYGYTCEPDFRELVGRPGCECGERRRPPVPVRVPEEQEEREREQRRVRTPEGGPGLEPVPARREVLEEIRDFVRRVVESGEDAGRAAEEFVREHPEVRYALYGAAAAIVLGTLIEDIATLGAGILDDPPSIAAALALIRAAQMAQ